MMNDVTFEKLFNSTLVFLFLKLTISSVLPRRFLYWELARRDVLKQYRAYEKKYIQLQLSIQRIRFLESCVSRIPDVSAKDVSAKDVSAKTWRRTFRQKKYAETSQAKKIAGTSRMIYAMYARSPSPSQRPASTTIASRCPFPLGLCSCSTSLSKMGI